MGWEYVFTTALMLSVGTMIFLVVRTLPRLDEETFMRKGPSFSERWFSSGVPEKIDRAFNAFLGKFFRKLKVALMKLDNFLTERLKKMSAASKEETKQKIDFNGIQGVGSNGAPAEAATDTKAKDEEATNPSQPAGPKRGGVSVEACNAQFGSVNNGKYDVINNMVIQDLISQIDNVKVNEEAISKIEVEYGAKLLDEVKRVLSFSVSGCIFDDKDIFRLLSTDEIIKAKDELMVDFKERHLVPILDIGDNNFVAFDYGRNRWVKINIADEVVYGESNSFLNYLK